MHVFYKFKFIIFPDYKDIYWKNNWADRNETSFKLGVIIGGLFLAFYLISWLFACLVLVVQCQENPYSHGSLNDNKKLIVLQSKKSCQNIEMAREAWKNNMH